MIVPSIRRFLYQAPGSNIAPDRQIARFYDRPQKREVKCRLEVSKKIKSQAPLFECSVLGCVEAFETFGQQSCTLTSASILSTENSMMRSEETGLTNFHRSDTADIRSCSSDPLVQNTSRGHC